MDAIFERLREHLMQTKYARPNNNGRELATVRCPFCGDSHKSNNPHLYIAVKENGVIKMDCKKCFTQGNFTVETLHRLGIYDIEIEEYIKQTNKMSDSHKVQFDNGKITGNRVVEFPNSVEKEKVEYLINRTSMAELGSKKERDRYRIILNLKDFLDTNKINYPLPGYVIQELSDNGIGFLSHDNKSISVRDLTKSSGTKYTIMHFDKIDRTPYLYIPPCDVDVLTDNPTIVLGEGAFDIMCIKKYFYPSDITNTIFAATGTRKSYKRVILQLLKMTCFFGADVVAYLDNDKDFSVDDYREDFSMFNPSMNVKFVMNQNGKDFGERKKDEVFEYKTFRL